jgi:hypothetical protein
MILEPRKALRLEAVMARSTAALFVAIFSLAASVAVALDPPEPEPCLPSLVQATCMTGDRYPTNGCIDLWAVGCFTDSSQCEVGLINDDYAPHRPFAECSGLHPWVYNVVTGEPFAPSRGPGYVARQETCVGPGQYDLLGDNFDDYPCCPGTARNTDGKCKSCLSPIAGQQDFTTIQDAIDGPDNEAVLCPSSVWVLIKPVKLKPNSHIYTLGLPEGDTRAFLQVASGRLSVAIDAVDKKGVVVESLRIDGGRRGNAALGISPLGHMTQTCVRAPSSSFREKDTISTTNYLSDAGLCISGPLVAAGGSDDATAAKEEITGQTFRNLRLSEPRDWTALHVRQGAPAFTNAALLY